MQKNVSLQEVRRRYPSHDGNYKDYVSTFEAESAVDLFTIYFEANVQKVHVIIPPSKGIRDYNYRYFNTMSEIG